MRAKRSNPTIFLATKRRGKVTSCEPDSCKMCEPPSGPGFYQSCEPDCVIECAPAGGPGYIRK